MQTECPRCGQGSVDAHVVAVTGESILLCDECDAVWPEASDPATSEWQDFTAFMTDRGRPGLWTELLD